MASSFSLRDHFAYLPPPAECLAILVGGAECIIFGLGGLTDPAAFAKGYGLLTPSASDSPETKKTHSGLVKAIAARNIHNGFLILAFALYTRDRKALGITVASGVIMTLADALIVNAYGATELVGAHAIGVVNSLLIGGSLLYWSRDDKFPWFN